MSSHESWGPHSSQNPELWGIYGLVANNTSATWFIPFLHCWDSAFRISEQLSQRFMRTRIRNEFLYPLFSVRLIFKAIYSNYSCIQTFRSLFKLYHVALPCIDPQMTIICFHMSCHRNFACQTKLIIRLGKRI